MSHHPFTVTARNGFLPLRAPPARLPPAYEPLDRVVRDLPALLASGALAAAVAALPPLPVEREADPLVLQALMRDLADIVDGAHVAALSALACAALSCRLPAAPRHRRTLRQ
jgi:hypothetical protein